MYIKNSESGNNNSALLEKKPSQLKNKSDATLRLITFFRNAMINKKKRIKTSPKKSSIQKRLDDKRKNSFKKRLRKKTNHE